MTSLELRLHDVGPQVLSGQIIYPFDRAGEMKLEWDPTNMFRGNGNIPPG